MAKTFKQMVAEAREGTEVISPVDAQKRVQENPNTLVLDVRQSEEIPGTGAVPGSMNVPLGVLPLRADTELPESSREAKLQDRSTPIITTCGGGGQAALAAKTLKEMGFTNVAIMDGGTRGWKEAGLPVEGQKG
jgi:rhodanese-related sulfurtransferase